MVLIVSPSLAISGSISAVGASNCTACIAGKYQESYSATCTECAAGHYCLGGAYAVMPSQLGSVSASSASECTARVAGTRQRRTGEGKLVRARAGPKKREGSG